MGRPLVLGEFGLRNTGRQLAQRQRIYQAWLDCALETRELVAAASWSFATDDRPDEWDAYTWRWRSGSDPVAEENRYADLHRRWARRFQEAES